jgi:hypothetical protein
MPNTCSICRESGHNKRTCTKNIIKEIVVPKPPVIAVVDDEKKTTSSQSSMMRQKIVKMNEDGKNQYKISKKSETNMKNAIPSIMDYAISKFSKLDAKIKHRTYITLYELQCVFHRAGGPTPTNIEKNKKVNIRPDGGIIFATINNVDYPLLILEDKVQGTNDLRLSENKEKQSTGNAIERAAKNIKASEMLFCEMNVFPYLIFASGCDFHNSETISTRLEMMNYGIPNHYLEITKNKNNTDIAKELDTIINNITIKKLCGKDKASIFVKAHKWDELPNGSSLWGKEEIEKICYRVIDKMFEEISKII